MSRPTAGRADVAGARRRGEGGLPVSVATLLGALALAPTVGVLVLRVLRNAPATLPPVLRGSTPTMATIAAFVPAFAVIGLAAATDRRAERVALAAVGVFALLGAVDAAAWLPAAAATVAGASAVLAIEFRGRAGHSTRPLSRATLSRIARPALVTGLGVAALAVSLAASAGVATATLRPAGATLAFATLAALPIARALDGVDLGLWVVAAFAVTVGAVSAPFVAGAVVLVAFGAGSVPFVLLALGIGGALATTVADARRGALGPAVAAALLLSAGVPATLPRAVAFAFGLVLLAREWGPMAGDIHSDGTAPSAGGVADA
ncbi:hypothetical protein [Halosimplex salinum]|uniref:hypothetical protein n=1 Tax=Halosimplex salinum TaxID=1710538 RepID=UPI000F49C981|nr:hypothetical protein [Halosimplex salinum]